MERPGSTPLPIQPAPPSAHLCSSAAGNNLSSKLDNTGHTPPYWNRHTRSVSSVSYSSIQGSVRPTQIILEDNTEPDQSSNSSRDGLWAKGVTIDDRVVVSGSALGSGAYVVWICKVDMLEGGSLEIRKRYSEFDRLRADLSTTFPNSRSALPALPTKSIVSRFRDAFLEKRRQGLQYFLKCVVLNPEFAGSPILKDFVFA